MKKFFGRLNKLSVDEQTKTFNRLKKLSAGIQAGVWLDRHPLLPLRTLREKDI